VAGSEEVTLQAAHTPPHTHTISFSAKPGTATSPKPASPSKPLAVGANAQTMLKDGLYVSLASGVKASTALKKGSVKAFVGGQPHENRQPFQVLNYIIAWSGIFPTQN
jgi:microcystin-dependent protein